MNILKQHWKTILLTIGATSLAVYVVVMGVIIFTAPKINAEPQAVATIDLKIKGNKSSMIYHLRGCPNYNDIAERNIVWFKTEGAAQAAGYRKARNC